MSAPTGSYVVWECLGMLHIRWFRDPLAAQRQWTMLHEGGIEASIKGAVAYTPPVKEAQ